MSPDAAPVQLETSTSETAPESYLATPTRQRPAEAVPGSPDDLHSSRRLALLKEELDAIRFKRVRHLISGTMPEKEMLTHLQEAVRIVDDIYSLQVHGSNLIWRQQIQKSGSDVEKLFISRFGQPWCRRIADAECNAVASQPPFRTGTVFWPADLDADEMSEIRRMINARELLSPFSLVVRDGASRYRAVPYPQDVRFENLFRALSESFKKASDAAPAGQREQLSRLSEIVMSGDIEDFGLDEQVAAGGQGKWRIIFDGFSTSLDPFGMKPAFELTVGRVEEPSHHILAQFQSMFSDFQQAYQMVSAEFAALSTSPKFDQWTVVDEWLVAGRIRRAFLDSEYHRGIDQQRRLMRLQQYEAAREGFQTHFNVADDAGAHGKELWTTAFCVFLAAANLISAEALTSDDLNGFLLSSRISATQKSILLKAMRDSAALWIIDRMMRLEAFSAADFEQLVAVVLSEFLWGPGSEGSEETAQGNWILNQLIAHEAVVAGVENSPILLNLQQVLSVGSALFEKLNRAIVTRDRDMLKQLFLQFLTARQTSQTSSGAVAQFERLILEATARSAVEYEFRLEFQ